MAVTSTKMASRDCGLFELTVLATKKKALRLDYANTITLNMTADTVKAKKRGRDAISFSDPLEGTLEAEIQVYPFELFSILGNTVVGGIRAEMTTLTASEAGKLTLPEAPKANTVYVYAKGNVGGTQIDGTTTGKNFSATSSGDIAAGSKYDVSYIVDDSTMNVVKINDNQELLDYRVDLVVPQKTELGTTAYFHYTCYKATPQRNMEFAFAAEGDPITVKITFDLMTDADDEFVDMYKVDSVTP